MLLDPNLKDEDCLNTILNYQQQPLVESQGIQVSSTIDSNPNLNMSNNGNAGHLTLQRDTSRPTSGGSQTRRDEEGVTPQSRPEELQELGL